MTSHPSQEGDASAAAAVPILERGRSGGSDIEPAGKALSINGTLQPPRPSLSTRTRHSNSAITRRSADEGGCTGTGEIKNASKSARGVTASSPCSSGDCGENVFDEEMGVCGTVVGKGYKRHTGGRRDSKSILGR